MPLYKGRSFSPVKPATSGGLKDTIYIIPHTNEQFVSKEYLFVSSTGAAVCGPVRCCSNMAEPLPPALVRCIFLTKFRCLFSGFYAVLALYLHYVLARAVFLQSVP